MDLGDLQHNTRDGLHIASLAGAWLAAVAGFGGMRDHGGELSFAPQAARSGSAAWPSASRSAGRRVKVDIERRQAHYSLLEGEPLETSHHGQAIVVKVGETVTLPVPDLTPRPAAEAAARKGAGPPHPCQVTGRAVCQYDPRRPRRVRRQALKDGADHQHHRVAGARRPLRLVAPPPPAGPVRRRRPARRQPGGRGRRPVLRLLQEPGHGRDHPPAGRAGRAGRPAAAHRRHVRGREDQRHRGPGRAARGPAGARGTRTSSSTASTWCPRSTPCSTGWATSPPASAPASTPATPASGSATSSTSASAAPTSGPHMAYEALKAYTQRDMTFRFVSNVDGADIAESLIDLDPDRDPVHRLLEDVRHPGDADQRQDRPGLAPARGRATRRRWPSTSWRCRPTPSGWPPSGSTPPTCSSSGTGSAAATRSTRPSGCRW